MADIESNVMFFVCMSGFHWPANDQRRMKGLDINPQALIMILKVTN